MKSGCVIARSLRHDVEDQLEVPVYRGNSEATEASEVGQHGIMTNEPVCNVDRNCLLRDCPRGDLCVSS